MKAENNYEQKKEVRNGMVDSFKTQMEGLSAFYEDSRDTREEHALLDANGNSLQDITGNNEVFVSEGNRQRAVDFMDKHVKSGSILAKSLIDDNQMTMLDDPLLYEVMRPDQKKSLMDNENFSEQVRKDIQERGRLTENKLLRDGNKARFNPMTTTEEAGLSRSVIQNMLWDAAEDAHYGRCVKSPMNVDKILSLIRAGSFSISRKKDVVDAIKQWGDALHENKMIQAEQTRKSKSGLEATDAGKKCPQAQQFLTLANWIHDERSAMDIRGTHTVPSGDTYEARDWEKFDPADLTSQQAFRRRQGDNRPPTP